MLEAKNYRFFNIPKKYSVTDYKEVLNYIIDKYSRINNLVSVYNWGDSSTPGISDIDIIFVLRSDVNNSLPFFNRSFYFLNTKARYLVRHPFIFIDENSFKDIRYIYPNTEFKLLYGKGIKINNISSADNYYSSITLLNDIIIRHYPRDFFEQSVNLSINVRDTLLRLNSLKYSIKMLESLMKEKNVQWNSKLRLIEELRKNWFKKNNFDLLVLLNKDAIKISMKITEKFRAFLIKNNLVKINSGNNVRYDGIKNKTLFIKDWNKGIALQKMSLLVKDKKLFYSILPIELSAQQIEYSKYNGAVSYYIKKNVSNDIDYQLVHKNTIEQRIKIFNKQAELASKLRHSDFVAFFDFGCRNESGINNRILNLLDKLRF
ncbi:MAG: hypothetical protein UW70_C0034G0001 [Candidatus Peregrinibacteria bacterium GW2011_GWA2_44_7]|nr:MAG: hypothetical protein UW70_C0034G0001 [Candidatus Peregrinibacteria bacterium GW2011_GWA2_44_7]